MFDTLSDAGDRIGRMILFDVTLLYVDFFGLGKNLDQIDRAIAKFLESIFGHLAFVVDHGCVFFEILQMDLADSPRERIHRLDRIPAPDLGPENVEFKFTFFVVQMLDQKIVSGFFALDFCEFE